MLARVDLEATEGHLHQMMPDVLQHSVSTFSPAMSVLALCSSSTSLQGTAAIGMKSALDLL